MTNYPKWVAEITVRDGVGRDSTVQFYVPEATAKLYFAAADKAARDATAIGTLFTDVMACMSGAEVQRKVWVEDLTSPVTNPSDDVLRGNKIAVGYQAAGRNYTFTIPTRNPASYTQKTDSIEIDLAAAGDFADFVTQFNAVCLSVNGTAATVTKAKLND